MLCDNHMDLVKSVYDNFEQINLTTPSEILPHTTSIKERLKEKKNIYIMYLLKIIQVVILNK